MDNKVYFIIEIQVSADGAAIVPPAAYTEKAQAEQAYHQALAAAAVSSLPIHSVAMLDESSVLIKSEVYHHQA